MTIIGASLLITGEIISQEDITIHGHVKGQIRMEKGSLVVGQTGNVDADVDGARMTLHGTLAGNVTASERIELTPQANFSGMLTARAVLMQDGATFNGLIDVERETVKTKAPLAVASAKAAPVAKAS
jgi:cytoskeletal protein CcmA (bactofilin family)